MVPLPDSTPSLVADDDPAVLKVRTIWISGLHLGTSDCQADALLEFLRTTECQTLYLVGDIVDGWQLRRTWYWPQAHNEVVQEFLSKVRKGTRVVFVPGNHDGFASRCVESLTALVEYDDGRLEIIDRGNRGPRPMQQRAPVRETEPAAVAPGIDAPAEPEQAPAEWRALGLI